VRTHLGLAKDTPNGRAGGGFAVWVAGFRGEAGAGFLEVGRDPPSFASMVRAHGSASSGVSNRGGRANEIDLITADPVAARSLITKASRRPRN
jgi:hypothetical protein